MSEPRTLPDFEGYADRECGEHRTTGARAWCFSCSEWCYEHIPCKGCELPMVRGLLGDLIDALSDEMRLEVSQSGHVIEHIEHACRHLGERYEGYIGSWL